MSENAGFEIERISKKVGCFELRTYLSTGSGEKTDYFFFLVDRNRQTYSSPAITVLKKREMPVPNVSNKHNVSKNIYSQGFLQLFLLRKGVFFFFNV